MSWEAKYPGVCGACGERFEVGTQVKWGEGATVIEDSCSLANVNAVLMQSREEIRAQRCTKCWLMHGKGQLDCE